MRSLASAVKQIFEIGLLLVASIERKREKRQGEINYLLLVFFLCIVYEKAKNDTSLHFGCTLQYKR